MRIRKWFLGLSMALLALPVFATTKIDQADQTGFYAGAQAGWGDQDFDSGSAGSNQFSNVTITSVNTRKSTDGLAGRVMIGYAFNHWFAVEAGLNQYHPATWNFTTNFITTNNRRVQSFSDQFNASTHTVDLLARLSWQPCKKLIVFGKAGIAYVDSDTSFGNDLFLDQHAYRPELAAGFDIPVNQNLAVEATYAHVFKQGDLHKNHFTPGLNTVLLGIVINHLHLA